MGLCTCAGISVGGVAGCAGIADDSRPVDRSRAARGCGVGGNARKKAPPLLLFRDEAYSLLRGTTRIPS